MQVVVHAAGCPYYNRRPQTLHRAMLVHSRPPSVTAHHPKPRIHRLEHTFYLQRQLTRRHQHHRLHIFCQSRQPLHQRQKEGQRFARTGRRKDNQTPACSVCPPHGLLHGVQAFYLQVRKYIGSLHHLIKIWKVQI